MIRVGLLLLIVHSEHVRRVLPGLIKHQLQIRHMLPVPNAPIEERVTIAQAHVPVLKDTAALLVRDVSV